ncbi:helix-turn-helix transcriptional regulator [Hymenobacter cheonanensis]|uniref:helix-turn-helix transcriptional regulator n=1 Tax=Hymenobacter sp. CA2-7 TaxID=3063993 RepID=UPI0027122A2C|nr:response regulator transcription factor [Hymenobacter sp. CA2-7]MDO7888118.1 response regulator transcription factor [Hymenobacter sp. CA2-7]
MKHPVATILVASRPTLLRHGLVTLLRERWPRLLFTVTAAASQVAEQVARRPFDLLVLDEALPGRALPALLAQLHRRRPSQRMVLLLNNLRSKQLAAAPLPWPNTRLLLPHHVPLPELVQAVAPWLDPVVEASPEPAPLATAAGSTFSARELEVLHLVVADCCNQEIANRLCVSVRTVESHRRTLLHKAGTHTSVGLAVRAVREGWVC